MPLLGVLGDQAPGDFTTAIFTALDLQSPFRYLQER